MSYVIAKELLTESALYAALKDWENRYQSHRGFSAVALSVACWGMDVVRAHSFLEHGGSVCMIVSTTIIESCADDISYLQQRFEGWHKSQLPTMYKIEFEPIHGEFIIEMIDSKY